MSSSRTLTFVLLEDNDIDAELLFERLHADGMHVQLQRARDRGEYLALLQQGAMDLILSDFSLPGYDGISALEAARQQHPTVPFIFVSGAIGEERAIETLQRGATDYVLKDRLGRLVPAVARALNSAEEQRKRLQAEAERDHLLVLEREARESAEAANRMKDEFLAVVSHELRTPLNAILGWATLLSTAKPEKNLLEKGLSTIERNARVQSRLIEDILDISRVITGKLQLRTDKTQVATFVNAAVEAVTPAAQAKHIQLAVELNQAVEVWGDADRLQQVVWNLLSNAIKFTPQGGKVRLSVECDRQFLTLCVSDTGNGIDPALLPHVFERFRQGDASATRRHGGLGLGLAIVRHLVELHGGTVQAHSAGLDQGASFVLRLPLSAPLASAKPEPVRSEVKSVQSAPGAKIDKDLSQLRILVLDDETDTRELVALILKQHGAQVTTVSSVPEALKVIQAQGFDVILSDIGMPDVDGYSFIRSVRQLPEPARSTPAIALTAYVRAMDRQRAAAAGFQRHLAKPTTPTLLINAVTEVVGNTGLQQATAIDRVERG